MINPDSPDFLNTPAAKTRPSFQYVAANPSSMPFVTIVTPFFNSGEIFRETVKSVQRQSLQQWNWIIVNDGSTDVKSLSILDEYRNSDPRIVVIDHESNRGPSAARNTGFSMAKTEYVVQLDSDNQIEPTAIEKWVWFLESYPEFSFVKGYTVGFGAEHYLWNKGFHHGEAFLEENLVDITSTIRKSTHKLVGGYDETIRDGLEDWDFWLRCASYGHWGGNIPEYLDWYRRRKKHTDRWPDWDFGRKQMEFQRKLRDRYEMLWNGKFPEIKIRDQETNESLSHELPLENRLSKQKPRLLMILPWLTIGGADKFNLDMVKQLIQRGWEVTIATTLNGGDPWLPHFSQQTPDVFILHHFLRLVDYPRFLKYLIQSRNIDIVFISNSKLGYLLLPYLRANFPHLRYIDYCHLEEEYWNNGGYPRFAIDYQELLDLSIVASKHLKQWMERNGADPKRIKSCYINIDTNEWRADAGLRASVRKELAIDDKIPILLYAGRILRQKQPRVFAKTMLRLYRKGLNFVSIVAGDGPDLEWLAKYISKNKLKKNVTLLGAVPIDRIKQLFAAADIFFLPSEWEGIALTLYEGMACSLPVVSADVGGQGELVTPECGILVKRSNEENESEEYSEILANLINNREKIRELGTAGRERVEKSFHIDRMGERIVTLFKYATDLSLSDPRPDIGKGLGDACASQAIEHTRLSLLTSELWNQSNVWSRRKKLNLREFIFLTIKRAWDPFHHWGINRGWYWLDPLAERVRRIILGS